MSLPSWSPAALARPVVPRTSDASRRRDRCMLAGAECQTLPDRTASPPHQIRPLIRPADGRDNVSVLGSKAGREHPRRPQGTQPIRPADVGHRRVWRTARACLHAGSWQQQPRRLGRLRCAWQPPAQGWRRGASARGTAGGCGWWGQLLDLLRGWAGDQQRGVAPPDLLLHPNEAFGVNLEEELQSVPSQPSGL